MEDVLLVLLMFGYLVGAFLTIRYVNKQLVGKRLYLKLLILASLNALFFGIGIIGSFEHPGDPGFALPAPNLIAIISTFFLDWGFIDTIIPLGIFVCWWILIYAILCFTYKLRLLPAWRHSR